MRGIVTILPKDVDNGWPLIEPFLKRFESETMTTSASDVRERLLAAEAQCWGYMRDDVLRGVAITEVRQNARGRYLNIWIICGELDEAIDDGLKVIEDWAVMMGCNTIEIIGRKGWKRRLEGFRERAVVLEKDLRTLQ